MIFVFFLSCGKYLLSLGSLGLLTHLDISRIGEHLLQHFGLIQIVIASRAGAISGASITGLRQVLGALAVAATITVAAAAAIIRG